MKVFKLFYLSDDGGECIQGIYSTKEKAEEAKVAYKPMVDLQIEECELDPPHPEKVEFIQVEYFSQFGLNVALVAKKRTFYINAGVFGVIEENTWKSGFTTLVRARTLGRALQMLRDAVPNVAIPAHIEVY